ELPGKKVIVMRGDIMHDYVTGLGMPDDSITATDTQEEALKLLSSGYGDCALAAKLPALFSIQNLRLPNLKAEAPVLMPMKYCYAVRNGDAELISRFSEGLAILQKNGEFKKLYEEWLGVYIPEHKYYEIFVLCTCVLLGLIALFIVWTRILHYQVKQRTSQLMERIEAQHQTEEKLRGSEERFRRLAENAQDFIYRMTVPDGVYEYVSPACQAISGYAPHEFYKQPHLLKHKIHPDSKTADERKWRDIQKGALRSYYDYQIIHASGDVRDLHERVVLVFDEQDIPCAVEGIITDITKLKNAEDDRRKIETKMLHAQKLESLGVLSGGIAHDFNNILMSILGNAGLALAETSSASPVMPYLRDIETAARRASGLTQQLLAYSGKGRFVVETLDLNEVVREMTHMLEVTISKKVKLTCNLSGENATIHADATQIRQIIMNLITNASEAIGEKSGVVCITTGVQTCDRDYLNQTFMGEEMTEGDYVNIEISDNGCGMSEETMHKMFDPFFTTKFTGRGLGMAAVQGIVRGHRGGIKVYSELGKGTTIKLLFPAVEAAAAKKHENSNANGGAPLTGCVLVVDDEESLRNVGSNMLKALGFTVLTANDGEEAIGVLQEHKGEITCVLLDLTMPRMDGEETFRELRRIHKEIPVIMTSGYNEQEITQRFVGKGLSGFIQKPFSLRDLEKKMRQLLT
ncbi:MAG: response regulator, partial [bacterium]|nr:response regulator [bacterium]